MTQATVLPDLRHQPPVNHPAADPVWAVWGWEWEWGKPPAGVVAWAWEAKVDALEVPVAKPPGLDLVATPHQVVVKPRHLLVGLLGESVGSVLQETLVATRIHRTRLKSEQPRSLKTQHCQPRLLVFLAEPPTTSTR